MGGRVAGADQYADDCLASKDGCRCQSIQADTQIGKVVVGYFPKNGLAVRVGPNDANGSHICFPLHDGDGLGKTTLTGWYSNGGSNREHLPPLGPTPPPSFLTDQLLSEKAFMLHRRSQQPRATRRLTC